jgi:hypothetical protein
VTTDFVVRLDDEEVGVLLAFMAACGLSTVNAALRTALFTQCRLSEIPMPAGCFDLDKQAEAEAVSA